ncbi:hypothetical protein GCM10007276_20700 [Agaricicola taiwanensis]|uniref:Lectin-like protein BA14k n=2 Tax=Agaricicola taiwanensis TaxID=591372 RepID=A0A8J2YHK6_9RHOB|nr:hypothetical protein GCM10007276_20700 [Agaricicola taiwanensis]
MVAAAIAVSGFGMPSAVQASPLKSLAGVNQSAVEDVQYRHGRRYHGHRYHGSRRYYRDRRYYRRDNGGAAVAAGVVGLAAGVLAGQALAQPRYAPAPAYSDRHAYCYSKYRSYDARTGTYLGYDGLRHYCQ